MSEFILSSDRSGSDHVKSVQARHATGVRRAPKAIETDDRPMSAKGSRTLMARRYGSAILIELSRKFGAKTVQLDMSVLTINEFEMRYGLSA